MSSPREHCFSMIPILFSEVRRSLLWPWESKRVFQSRTTLTVRKCSRGFNPMMSSKLSGKERPCSLWSDVTLGILASPWQLYLEGKFYEADFYSWLQTTQTTWLLLTSNFNKNRNPINWSSEKESYSPEVAQQVQGRAETEFQAIVLEVTHSISSQELELPWHLLGTGLWDQCMDSRAIRSLGSV